MAVFRKWSWYSLLRPKKIMYFIRNVCASRGIGGINVKQILQNGFGGSILRSRLFHLSEIKELSEKQKPNLHGYVDNKTADKMNPKITLLTTDSMPTVIRLEQARKIAIRRDLKLVQIMDVDHKSQRPVYKLMTGAEFFEEDVNRRKERSLKKSLETKDPKLVVLSYKISNNDLASKIKNIIKWLNKRHEVRVSINAPGNGETADRIYTTIETEAKHAGKIVQKRSKGDDLKFQLLPLKKLTTDSNENSIQESDDVTMNKEST